MTNRRQFFAAAALPVLPLRTGFPKFLPTVPAPQPQQTFDQFFRSWLREQVPVDRKTLRGILVLAALRVFLLAPPGTSRRSCLRRICQLVPTSTAPPSYRLRSSIDLEGIQDLKPFCNIDPWNELCDVLANEIDLDLCTKALSQARPKCQNVRGHDMSQCLTATVRKYKPDWIVTGFPVGDTWESPIFGHCGGIEGVPFIYDSFMPVNQAIMGRNSDIQARVGVPLDLIPVVMDPNSFCPTQYLESHIEFSVADRNHLVALTTRTVYWYRTQDFYRPNLDFLSLPGA